MTDINPGDLTRTHIKALVDSGCGLDPKIIAGMFQVERAVALRAATSDEPEPGPERHDTYGGHDALWLRTSCGQPNHPKW
jgi:hypothetical protein